MIHAGPRLAAVALLAILGLGLGTGAHAATTGPATQADSNPDAAEREYRAKVVAFAAGMSAQAPARAEAAYAAVDGGQDSKEAKEFGGLEEARGWVVNFEVAYEDRQLRDCAFSKWKYSTPAQRFQALADSPQFESMLAHAQRLAPAAFTSLLAEQTEGSAEQRRAYAVLGALLSPSDFPKESHEAFLERGMLASIYMASGTEGSCVPGPRFLRLLERVQNTRLLPADSNNQQGR